MIDAVLLFQISNLCQCALSRYTISAAIEFSHLLPAHTVLTNRIQFSSAFSSIRKYNIKSICVCANITKSILLIVIATRFSETFAKIC